MEPERAQPFKNSLSRLFSAVLVSLLAQAGSVLGLTFPVSLVSLTNHNTSAYPAYNEDNFSANFGTTSWVNQNGATIPVDPTQMDESLNPITPGHVSKTDVHTLIPNRPDLRWFAHATPWFGTASHINIGLTNNNTAYVAAMITDMENRGFNGVVIDWYGEGDSTDGVTQKIKSYLGGIATNTFTYIVMIDKGVVGGTGTNNLQAQIQYCQGQYFGDSNYEHEPTTNGLPILMFFGVRDAVGQSAMTAMKAYTGGQMVWVEQGTSYLTESWEDESFEWTDCFTSGVNPNDPFNLSAVTSDFPTIKAHGKKAFGAMCARFNGTLTKSVSWSLGKYLPCSNGLCEVERAAAINAAIPSRMTRMQWPTWSDWEEGTQVEAGIENGFALSGSVNPSNLLSWTINSGDPRTIDHYEIYASTNGTTAALLAVVPATATQTNLIGLGLSSGYYSIYIDAIGLPCVRDHLSAPVACVVNSSPVIVQQPTNVTVGFGGTATFSVSAEGAQPLGYTWYDQSNTVVGSNSTLVVSNAAQNNSYYAIISNPFGSVPSGSAILNVVGAPVYITNPSNYYQMQIQFTGYTNTNGLADFPMLVRLSTNIAGFSYAQFVSPSNGADLRFITTNGLKLPFQIDQWNPAGESQIWVQLPSLGNTNDRIIALWGNPADGILPSSNTKGAVWVSSMGTNNFLVVYHLSQAGFPFIDSTLQNPATSGVSPTLTSGIIGNGALFNGTSQFLNGGTINVSKTFTVSAWVNVAPGASSEQTIWCNKAGGWNVAGFDFYVNSYQTNDGIIYFDSADGVGGNVSPRTAAHAVTFGQWHLLTGTMDGVNGAVHVYVDGVDATTNTGVDTAFQTTNYVRYGSLLTGMPGASGNLYFNGLMDEARIQNGVCSAAWVWASWATVASGNFITQGAISPPAETLYYQSAHGQITLTWTTGTLQSAPTAAGPYTDLAAATNAYALMPSNSQQYFRVRVK